MNRYGNVLTHKTVILQVTIGTEGVPVYAATWKNGRVGVTPFEHPTGKATGTESRVCGT